MRLFETQDTRDALENLLTREREAILGGRYNDLEKMIAEKERLLNAISKSRISHGDLKALKEQSERNGALLEAMKLGVKSALERLKEMQAPTKPLQTYDPAGRRTELGADKTTTQRRA